MVRSDVVVRCWGEDDIPLIADLQKAAYHGYQGDTLCDHRLHSMQRQAFPEGQFVALQDGVIVGYATSLIIELDENARRYRYDEITGNGTFSTHDPSGDTLFAADIAVHPDHRGKGVAAALYERRRQLVQQLNLKRMIAYGRLPGYLDHAGVMTPDEYVAEVVSGKRKDIALSAHLRAGYTVKGVLLDPMGGSEQLNHATFLAWDNPLHDSLKRKAASAPLRKVNRKVRICAGQFQMRRISDKVEFEQTCEFFAETANTYHCHFLVLPEYFTSQLLYAMPGNLSFLEEVDRLADSCEQVCELMIRLAKEYQLYIVAGSTPQRRNGKLYNVSFFITPSGQRYSQDKLHITPAEREGWGVYGGEVLRIFDTPLGRIAIQICYDIEFPELSRLLALAGVEIVFVPFNTDNKRSFYRVMYSAQARAVENYLYVVTAGLVGNLPTIKQHLVNYGQSAIYTPSDVAFPSGGVAAIADPNVETAVTGELDLETLMLQRELGSVRPFFDRRVDLYDLKAKIPIEIIRVE